MGIQFRGGRDRYDTAGNQRGRPGKEIQRYLVGYASYGTGSAMPSALVIHSHMRSKIRPSIVARAADSSGSNTRPGMPDASTSSSTRAASSRYHDRTQASWRDEPTATAPLPRRTMARAAPNVAATAAAHASWRTRRGSCQNGGSGAAVAATLGTA